MQATWLIKLGLVLVVAANLGRTLESNDASIQREPISKIALTHNRPERKILGFSFLQFLLTLNYSEPVVVTPVRKYVIQYQQPGQLPFSYPFNWPFSLIPVNIVSNQLFNNSLVPFPPLSTEVPNDLKDVEFKKDGWNCGKTSVYSQATTRIVDGDPLQYGEFPWLVAIMRDNERTHLCGGSLVSDRYVLSAHCYASYKVSDVSKLRVYIGDFNIYDPNDVRSQVRSVTRLIRHSKWNNPVNSNDVALLKLDTPVTFNNYVQPICLARGSEASFYSSGTVATVAGWGKVQWGYPELQRTPLKIQVPLVDKNTCQRSIYPHLISDSMICAGAGYKSTCLGDSGAPLAVYSNGQWFQIGIVSWGLNCNSVAIFSRVSSFANWIDKYMKA